MDKIKQDDLKKVSGGDGQEQKDVCEQKYNPSLCGACEFFSVASTSMGGSYLVCKKHYFG